MLFSDLSEFLYQARYSLLAITLVAWVAVVFVWEWRRGKARGIMPAEGPGVFHDPLLGPTMADGGQKEAAPSTGPSV